MLLNKQIPLKDRLAALWQWFTVGIGLIIADLLGIIMSFLAALTAKPMTNFVGETKQDHSDKYKSQGSSGKWEYWASPIPFIRLWSNLEDGDLGEPSGKQSVRVNGEERKFWNRYYWLAFRNPFNMGKRTIPFFHCLVDDCDIEYYGDRDVSDKRKEEDGWHFVKATNRETGKVYYGYRSVRSLSDTTVRQVRVGFKIKPSHAGEIQDADDKDKAFTLRYQHESERN